MIVIKPKRRLYTWKGTGDSDRQQLDYILVKHRFRNSVKYALTLPGADIDSDHNLLTQWIQDLCQSNVDNMNNVRHDASRHFRNKISYLKAKIEELEIVRSI
jgi:hypothetical protein